MKVILLAAGKGTRMKQDRPKVLTELKGRPLLHWSLDAIEQAQIDPQPIVVVGHQADLVREAAAGRNVIFVEQREQKGTGHAVMMCRDVVDPSQDVLVLYGDHVLMSPQTLTHLEQTFRAQNAALALVTYTLPSLDVYDGHFEAYGRIIRDQSGRIRAIRERKDATPDEVRIKEINPAYYLFKGPWLWQNVQTIQPNNKQNEYYLTDLVELAIRQGEQVVTLPGADLTEAIGINTIEHLGLAERVLSQRSL